MNHSGRGRPSLRAIVQIVLVVLGDPSASGATDVATVNWKGAMAHTVPNGCLVMLFSQRYFSAIEERRLVIDLPPLVRNKLWIWLEHFNKPIGDPWNHGTTTTILEVVAYELKTEHGWDEISGLPLDEDVVVSGPLHHLVLAGHEYLVFDIVELAHGYMERVPSFLRRPACKRKPCLPEE